MDYSKLKKVEPVQVVPSGKTPGGLYLLSNLDQTFPYPIEIVFAYKGNGTNIVKNPTEILKTSLAKILEDFYPFAGCLDTTWDGKMMVNCTGDGVLFVEALIDEDMEVLGDLTIIDPLKLRKLIHFNETAQNILEVPPLTVQVTRFKCGGIILGVAFNHILVDDKAFADFTKCWCEVARGLPLSVPPYLERSIFSARQPPNTQIPHHEFTKTRYPLPTLIDQNQEIRTNQTFSFTPNIVSQMKKHVMESYSNQFSSAPTSFELVSALVWICWAKAAKIIPESTTKLLIAVDGLPKLQQQPPEGYFGNGIVWSCAQCNARDLTRKTLSFAVRIVQNAIKEVTEEYIRSAIDYHEVTRKGLDLENSLWMTEWNRLPFYEANFGWGEPIQVAQASLVDNLVITRLQGKDSENIAVSLSLPASQMEVFRGLVQPEGY
ncbi:Omega-hydroxypalmitate O-feruloyl transferase [Forsythia ovata]|uniref:Omega-hydroxypalmitate O-feruloyl transferase n=1 Tax=Forsythia ovata TaxID=205694 RepID=A0ABD1R235_9LAMI